MAFLQWLHGVYGIGYVHGAVNGFLISFYFDFEVFLSDPTWTWKTFNWGVASKRWIKGAIAGSGLGAIAHA